MSFTTAILPAAEPGSLSWFARHEMTLSWRRWLSIMAGGTGRKGRFIAIGLVAFIAGLHALAYMLLKPILGPDFKTDISTLVAVTSTLLLSFSMMLSQTLESVTRAFYTRDDLDLILSSPTSAQRVFAVRVGAIAFSSAAMTALLAAPVINVAAILDGAHWFWSYAVVASMGMLATATAVLLTLAMFRIFGAKRTRLFAQILAAVVGATFLIGIQIAAILSMGKISRFAFLSSDMVVNRAPDADSWFWLPAQAAFGNPVAAIVFFVFAVACLVGVIATSSDQFGEQVLAAAGLSHGKKIQAQARSGFRNASRRHAMRVKEWALLKRDPWLVSQTLMQILYLIPPALILWINHGQNADAHVILAPVLVMAIGQLAGGLAWLAISGEDAPDLVQTAPISNRAATLAKIEAILLILAALVTPFIIGLAFLSVWSAAVTAIGVVVAASSTIAIQMWFQSRSRRRNFRRRQTASRIATFSEAFASISWAGTAGLAAAGSAFAIILGAFGVVVMLTAWLLSPRQRTPS
ncbi:MAG: permease [Hyphomicrobiaceae bacterium]